MTALIYTERYVGGRHHGRYRTPHTLIIIHREGCRTLRSSTRTTPLPEDFHHIHIRHCKVCDPYPISKENQ